MGAWQPLHWAIVFGGLLTVIPAARGLIRVGLSPWWALLSIIPVVGWFRLWAFAFAPWPSHPSAKN